ncbi:MAG: TAXI family TRAP transporter solute-binding subunit [Sedimenticolaceae bacterium]|uniref:TAXI family TRAP transporter solute-binding subunit n=2 Tax=Candidatus Vondammii sp. HM_W22 TaxID=2687299 RepID=UPI001F135565|nr:TAXI family TRAP transporter solute-binding subunit [Candidatus Vondammii sp. HM_W22]
MKMQNWWRLSLKGVIAATAISLFAAGVAMAETRIAYKSAKSTSSYYQMAVQIAEAVKRGSNGDFITTVEESQGSVQNVKEVAHRSGNYVFTTPPMLIKLAQGGKKMFKDASPNYQKIRALFVIPSLTMHLVVRKDSGTKQFRDLTGKKFLIGKGSFGAREAAKYIKLFGLEGKVDLVDVELNSAAGTEISLISMTDEQVVKTKRTKLVIPAGTYPGVNYDVTTTSLPVGAYTTTAMDDTTAYRLTKTYWEQKQAMGEANPWWNAVTFDSLKTLGGKLHPGAVIYYKEAGATIPEQLL